jgi:DNA-binding transcriptional LysR family regulator
VQGRVAAAQADFGLMADEAATTGLQHSVFAHMTGVVVMRADHALARVKSVELAQLAKVPFIALNPEDTARRQLETAMAEHGLQLNVTVHTPYAASVCELALAGLGVGVVNPITALDYAARGLAVRALTSNIAFKCLLVMPPAKVLSLPAQSLLAVMRVQLHADTERIKLLLR